MPHIPNITPGESECCHGAGLRPKQLEHELPNKGGMYSGQCPKQDVQAPDSAD